MNCRNCSYKLTEETELYNKCKLEIDVENNTDCECHVNYDKIYKENKQFDDEKILKYIYFLAILLSFATLMFMIF